MNTPPDISYLATGASYTDALLLRAVANMRPGWILLRDCKVGDGDSGVEARVRYALLHPQIGIALLDVLPGTTTHGVPDRLRRLMHASNFHAVFEGYPPIVYLCVPRRALSSLGLLLIGEFNLLPALALAGGNAWVGAAQRLLTVEPPMHPPERRPIASGRPLAPWTPEPASMGDWREPRPGLRGLAAFWGMVAVVFGGGALVLQHLGPPEQPSAAHASGIGPGEAWVSRARPETWPTSSHPDRPQMPSPSPVLAMWPAERMPTPFDPARASTVLRDPGDLSGVAPSVDGNHLAIDNPDPLRRRPSQGAQASTHSAHAGSETTVTGADAGNADGAPGTTAVAGAAAPAGTASIHTNPAPGQRALVPSIPAPARGDDGGADAIVRQAFGTLGGAGASPPGVGQHAPLSGASATERYAFNWFARRTLTGSPPTDGLGAPADTLPALSNSLSFAGPSTASPSAVFSDPARTGASTALGLGGDAAIAADIPPAASLPPEIEALLAAIAEKVAPSDPGAIGPAIGAGGAPDPVAGPGTDSAALASAAHIAGSDNPSPLPSLGAVEPTSAPVQAAVPSDAAEFPPVADAQGSVRAGSGGSQVRSDHRGADLRPLSEHAGSAAAESAAMPAAPQPVPEPSTMRQIVPVPGFPSAPASQARVPPADSEPDSPVAAPAPFPGASTTVVEVPQPEAGGTVLDAGPAPEDGRIATAPLSHPTPPGGARGLSDTGAPPLTGARIAAPVSPPVETTALAEPTPVPVARPGLAPDIDPAAARSERAQTAAMSGPPRPAAPEPHSGAAAQTGGTFVNRTPVAPERSAFVESLVARGDTMMARRDISSARLLYERAATADPRAAAGLAKTYDPAFLAEIGVRGIQGDATLAAAWYQKAISLGDGSAAAKLEAINGLNRAFDKKQP